MAAWRGQTAKLMVIIIKFRCSGFSFAFSCALNILSTTWKTGNFSSIITPAGRDQRSDKLIALSSLILMASGAHGQSCPGLRARPNLCRPRRQSRDKRQVLISVGNVSHRRPHSMLMTESRMKPRNSDHLSYSLSTNDTAYS